MFYYQRCGTPVTQANGGNWYHPVCHEASNQDLACAGMAWRQGHAPAMCMVAGTTPAI